MVQRRRFFLCQLKNNCMKKQILACAILFSIIGCSKKIDPELPQNLKAKIEETTDCTCLPYLNLYEWKGQAVYLYGFAGPACNSVPAYYDKDGKPLMLIAIYTFEQFIAESKLVKNIWKCK